ncbi:MAG TPA: hypothetical protein VMM13_20030, partial [Euzebya sp.]|nr:hypothetical protein [Euzebya sp.]
MKSRTFVFVAHPASILLLSMAVLAALLIVAGPAGAATTLVVDDDGLECPDPDHSDLASAIAVAVAGDTIEVCPGNYPEPQLVVDEDLTIVGVGDTKPVIRPTSSTGNNGDARGFFLVLPGATFDLDGVVIDGAGVNVWQAIRNRGGGSVTDVDFRN